MKNNIDAKIIEYYMKKKHGSNDLVYKGGNTIDFGKFNTNSQQ